jgi:4-hydroxy-3-methylbut-2-en-1-yl diphosphate reductase
VTAGAIVVALRLEAWALAGRTGGAEVLRTGMGPRSVARVAPRITPRPGWLSAGLAGGLTPEIAAGDLIVATEVVDLAADGPRRITVPAAEELAQGLRRLGLRVHLGSLAFSPTVVHGTARATLAARGAAAVDMESGALAELAHGRPFAAVRAIVDTPDTPLLRPGTPRRALAALRSLRVAGPVLGAWVAAIKTVTDDSLTASGEVI